MFDLYADVVNVDEMCKMQKIGKNTAYILLSTNTIRSKKIGKVYKIPKKNIERFLEVDEPVQVFK
jgi:excisionase family DNA binding protein